MTTYLPPSKISQIFNIDDYDYQDGFIVFKEADQRYLRPIQKLNQKTAGITYVEYKYIKKCECRWVGE